MSLEIVWSALARRRLQEIHDFVATDNPAAAERLAVRIVAAVETLRDYPHLGRTGTHSGTRELVIGKTPYLVVYQIRGRVIRISTVWHGAQRRYP